MLTFIINDIAADSSGALTILKDCIDYIETNHSIDVEYHLFTSVDIFDSIKNVFVHKIKKQGWVSRIAWDNGGLQNWCVVHNIHPDIIISLQNTSTKFIANNGGNIPQLVYFHHPMPLISYRWNIFKRQEFILFLSAHLYSFFVSRNNKSSYYVVQLQHVREIFLQKFKKIEQEKVFVIRPNNPFINIDSVSEISLNRGNFYFLYPATALNYKNHKIIIQALVLLQREFSSILNNIKIIFTVTKLDSVLMKMIKKHNLLEVVQLIGQIPYNEILSYYNSVDALLFPSQFETFGLPLAEASSFGLPIIAANLSYAREVLEKYDNKILIDPESAYLWADAMKNYQMYKKYSPSLSSSSRDNSWAVFFKLANEILMDVK